MRMRSRVVNARMETLHVMHAGMAPNGHRRPSTSDQESGQDHHGRGIRWQEPHATQQVRSKKVLIAAAGSCT